MQRAFFYMKRWTWLILLCPVLAGGITLVIALVQPPIYEATANLVFGLANPTNPSYVSPTVAAQLGSTYTIMLESPNVLQAAAAQLGLQETTEQLSSRVHASYQSGSNIIILTADASTADLATRLADAVVNAFRRAVQQVSPIGKDVVLWGAARTNPVKLKGVTFSTAGMAMPLGLLAALNVVALLYYLDDTIFTAEDITTAASVPVLSAPLPHTKQRLLMGMMNQGGTDDAAPLLLEAVRASAALPTTIFCAWTSARDRDPHQVMCLASAAAHAGLRVLVVNTDSDYPWLHSMYGLSEARGLKNALAPGNSLKPYIFPLATPGIAVVPAGQAPTSGNEPLLSSSRLEQLLAPLRRQVDLILITGAPILADSTAALPRAADGVVLMAGAQCTRRSDIRGALAILHRVHASVLGVALGSAHDGLKACEKPRERGSALYEAKKVMIAEETRELD